MRIVAAAVISWLGLLVHNVADLPDQTLISPETLYPGIFLALLGVLIRGGSRRLGAALLLGWAILDIVGGGLLSVLPLGILPFEAEQSLRH